MGTDSKRTLKETRWRILMPLVLCTVCCILWAEGALAAGQGGSSSAGAFSALEDRLMGEGFSREKIRGIYRAQPEPLFKSVSKTFYIRESKLDYDQFLSPSSIARAQEFRRKYKSLLTQAEALYGVDHRVIVAILLVETQFGSYTGKTHTLAVFSTFALMDRKPYRDKVWALLSPEQRKRWGREAFDLKLETRAKWAYQELCALIRLTDTHGVRVDACRGSVMGAIGWPQFLPSSLVRYGVDGNEDGSVDLYQPADAIFSVANYFRGHGWRQEGDRSSHEEVVYAYNHSRPYVQAILGVADRLRQSDASGTAL